MRREGRQHGMVRTSRIPRSPWDPKPKPRSIQQLDSSLIVGIFTEVSKKPTNHSKFTGRCGKARCLGCHMHPACKAKNKTKGCHKLKSSNMTRNSRFITWSVACGGNKLGLKFSRFSATSVLNHLYNDIGDCYKGNNDHDDDDCLEVNSRSLKEIENNEGESTHETIDDEDDDENVKLILNQDVEDSGFSATSVLNHLYNDIGDCYKGNNDHDDDHCLEVNSRSLKEIENNEDESTHETIYDDENVKLILNQDMEEEEEGWYMVGEI